MQKFTILKGIAAPLPVPNVDTDKIIPKQYLKTIERTGLGKYLFDEIRFTSDRKEIPDFVLNKEPYRHAKILVAGENFGCGSSREHAPWALLDFGIRCVIAPSFADIFYNNCFKNGILPLSLPAGDVAALMKAAEAQKEITVDLPAQKVEGFSFDIDAFRKHCLIEGLDDIGLTLEHAPDITAFEKQQRGSQPWLYQA
ncbi:MAG: 3-isopropylmalate dehydratase small subunit [Alphaproteobacteria bacterium]|nr:3-isopropylmalate dehydratase small subunit [Alphaproteobacteria bacterium]MDE2336047.1 3-isopropylmalate dehydratase small subunit [Alphaproteobacteria bacterium]